MPTVAIDRKNKRFSARFEYVCTQAPCPACGELDLLNVNELEGNGPFPLIDLMCCACAAGVSCKGRRDWEYTEKLPDYPRRVNARKEIERIWGKENLFVFAGDFKRITVFAIDGIHYPYIRSNGSVEEMTVYNKPLFGMAKVDGIWWSDRKI